MTHRINGFIGPTDELTRLTETWNHAAIVPLDVPGISFLPLTHKLSAEVGNAWYDFGKKATKSIVHVETDYFGGAGEQSAAVWINGWKGFRAKKTGAINKALAHIGLKPHPGKDLFDTVGLGKYRTNEDWAASSLEEYDRQEALKVLDALAAERDSDPRLEGSA